MNIDCLQWWFFVLLRSTLQGADLCILQALNKFAKKRTFVLDERELIGFFYEKD
tara:strand:- start:2494 stop:2655 length:162 start_codon:yes stop_codon:yes gene_type:complete